MTGGRRTVVLIDDHELFREGLSMMIDIDGTFRVAGQGGTSESAVKLSALHKPDLLILDVELHDEPAQVTIRRIARLAPDTRVVVLTMHRDALIGKSLIRAGASAFLTKSIPRRELLEALKVVAQRPKAMPLVSVDTESALLSTREMDVLRLLATSQSMREIGQSLGIAEGTVKRHTASIYLKLSVRSRIQALPKARLLGLLEA